MRYSILDGTLISGGSRQLYIEIKQKDIVEVCYASMLDEKIQAIIISKMEIEAIIAYQNRVKFLLF